MGRLVHQDSLDVQVSPSPSQLVLQIAALAMQADLNGDIKLTFHTWQTGKQT